MADPLGAAIGIGVTILFIAALPYILLLVALWRIGTGTQATAAALRQMTKHHETAASGLLALQRIADAAAAQVDLERGEPANGPSASVSSNFQEAMRLSDPEPAPEGESMESQPSAEVRPPLPPVPPQSPQGIARTLLFVFGALITLVGVVWAFDDNSGSLVTGLIIGGIGLITLVAGSMVPKKLTGVSPP